MGFGFEYGMFSIVSIMVPLIFLIVISMFIVTFIKSFKQWNKNNNSPVLTVDVKVVTKRINVTRHHHGGADDFHHTTTSSRYYVTFEVSSGDRMEFLVPGSEYGVIAENDTGKLTFQGTRYLSFERIKI